MILVSEATFTRQVLRAELPVLVWFGMRRCPTRPVLMPSLERIGVEYQERLRVAGVLLDNAPLLGEQYGIGASPTLVVFQHGDRQGQVIGFIPEGLLRLLADDVARGAVSGDIFWSPVEERFEDTVMIPLLHQWGFSVERQVSCALTRQPRQQRGRIDLLVYDQPSAPPLTLVESKRQIRGAQDVEQAAAQAAGYARSLALPSFVVAAPRGLWIYRNDGKSAICVRHITSLELHQAPELPRQILLRLRADAPTP